MSKKLCYGTCVMNLIAIRQFFCLISSRVSEKMRWQGFESALTKFYWCFARRMGSLKVNLATDSDTKLKLVNIKCVHLERFLQPGAKLLFVIVNAILKIFKLPSVI